MGFFSSLLRIGGALLGVPAAVAPRVAAPVVAAAKAVAVSPSARTAGLAAVGGLVGTGAAMALAPAVAPAAEPTAAIVPFVSARGRLAMKNRISTVVQTIAPDGRVIDSQVLEGAPFLMRKDFVTAKRVRKLISKAKAKIAPSKREESEQTKLMKAVVTTATRRVLTGPDCPPKC